LVALRYDVTSEGDGEQSPAPRIVGCVGVRRLERNKANRVGDGDCLEIFRLAVDESCRGVGIAKNLLRAVERFARMRRSPKLIANTLTILDGACRLYESFGYSLEDEAALGATELVMRTYVKALVE
jgi:ribosomal protein S18 acetylase RimI-like enzyme